MKILVGYASVHESTAELARCMGSILEECGCQVQVAAVESVTSLNPFDAFLLGSAVHSSSILPPMAAFVRRFKDELTLKPVYFFITCIRVLEPGGYQHALENYIPYDVAPGITPQKIAVFAGRIEWSEIKPGERWAMALDYDGDTAPHDIAGDYRDWDAIRAWTLEVAADLGLPSPQARASKAQVPTSERSRAK